MTEPDVCGRCGATGREADVRLSLANLAREARRDGREPGFPHFEHALRCRPCRELNRQPVTRREP